MARHRICSSLCLDSFSALVQLVTQCTLLYTVSLVFSHKSIVVCFILICTSLVAQHFKNMQATSKQRL